MALQDDIQIYEKRRVLYAVVAVIFLLFIGRLFQLQMIYSEEYGKKSEENSIRIIPREPVRGYMYDRNGVRVVDNRPSFTVTIMPFEFDKRKIGLPRAHALPRPDVHPRPVASKERSIPASRR